MFRAHSIHKTSFSTNEIIIFSSATVNTGSGYSTTTGKFTAPIDGQYLFVKQICMHSGNYGYTAFVHNNNIVLKSLTGSNLYSCASAQTFLQLSKGDQFWVKATDSRSGFIQDQSEGTTYFAGVLMSY